ncbi:hypothetical protein [Planotetraspora kaengkrachanensis]|uniref:Uncharacterized protein n=1 Tax=Planotetraspora kaengkrachanensis TaxID=575193 RepID=A0A8J3LUQ0_9ACTN|nr:hypothetical protein [Planotetraspora kaengkrachanensis]GIG79107.1 hypothetical protein Pka01_22340 [Planotetraspora kaengkrachanensis]
MGLVPPVVNRLVRRWSTGRFIFFVVGAGLACVAVVAGSSSYADAYDFADASRCDTLRADGRMDCITTVAVTVVSRSISTTPDHQPPVNPLPNPPPLPPPQPPIFRVAAVGEVAAADVDYKVVVEVVGASHRRYTIPVDKQLYDKARPGAHGMADMWRGHVLGLSIGGSRSVAWIPMGFAFACALGWVGAVLMGGSLLVRTRLSWSAFDRLGLIGFPLIAAGFFVPFLLAVPWRPAWRVVPVVMACLAAILIVAVLWANQAGLRRGPRR